MKAYQMCCNGRYVFSNAVKTLYSENIYLRKESITEEVIDKFKDYCAEGGVLCDMDKSSMVVKVLELEIIDFKENEQMDLENKMNSNIRKVIKAKGKVVKSSRADNKINMGEEEM